MEVKAKLKNANFSAQKGRLVANQIRGMDVESALNLLGFSTRKAADSFKKLLNSAIANAEHNEGRGNKILKRNCHLTIEVSDTK